MFLQNGSIHQQEGKKETVFDLIIQNENSDKFGKKFGMKQFPQEKNTRELLGYWTTYSKN